MARYAYRRRPSRWYRPRPRYNYRTSSGWLPQAHGRYRRPQSRQYQQFRPPWVQNMARRPIDPPGLEDELPDVPSLPTPAPEPTTTPNTAASLSLPPPPAIRRQPVVVPPDSQATTPPTPPPTEHLSDEDEDDEDTREEALLHLIDRLKDVPKKETTPKRKKKRRVDRKVG